MGKYYHFTSYNNFYSIMEKGLIPNSGFRCKSIDDKSYGVFLSKGIDKSILMCALMLSYYEKYNIYEGQKTIDHCMNRIEYLKRRKEFECTNKAIDYEIDDLFRIIDRVNMIRKCETFDSYLGGPCFFLSVNDLEGIDEEIPENCRYDKIIPPHNINVVNIINKCTGEHINSLHPVLSYFMCLYPVEEVFKITGDENRSGVLHLYQYISSLGYGYCNPYNYDLVEIPITNYNQKIKTLI